MPAGRYRDAPAHGIFFVNCSKYGGSRTFAEDIWCIMILRIYVSIIYG